MNSNSSASIHHVCKHCQLDLLQCSWLCNSKIKSVLYHAKSLLSKTLIKSITSMLIPMSQDKKNPRRKRTLVTGTVIKKMAAEGGRKDFMFLAHLPPPPPLPGLWIRYWKNTFLITSGSGSDIIKPITLINNLFLPFVNLWIGILNVL